MEFTATEAGFENGLGGASNQRGSGEPHYVLFGIQKDTQHAEQSGVYFEWDGEENGAVDAVRSVAITRERVIFTLADGRTIAVASAVSAEDWERFLEGVEKTFGAKVAGARAR